MQVSTINMLHLSDSWIPVDTIFGFFQVDYKYTILRF